MPRIAGIFNTINVLSKEISRVLCSPASPRCESPAQKIYKFLHGQEPMATLHTINKDKVFPRQPQVAINPYATPEERLATRFHQSVGYGIQTPETAINATYIDKKCPFTGTVHVRGRIFKGVVHKMKADKTIVVMIRYLFYNKKYKRYARRNSKINVHLSPCFNGLVNLGDTVICGETRPLSKTKAAAVIGIDKKAEGNTAKLFDGF